MPKNLADVITGEVVSIDDPTFHGRIKVRIKGLNDNIPVEELPWVTPAIEGTFSGAGGGTISIPRVGSKVRIRNKKASGREDQTSYEWTGPNRIDNMLAAELSQSYEGSHSLLYDSESDLSIMFLPSTGLRLFYQGSFIQISPDNTITIHQGGDGSSTTIQLSDGKIDIQAPNQINITSDNTVKIEADSIVLNGATNVQVKGESPGEVAVNGLALYRTLLALARLVDMKVPGGNQASDLVVAAQSTILNNQIQYI